METYGSFSVLVNEDIYAPVNRLKNLFYTIMRSIFVDSYNRVVNEEASALRMNACYNLEDIRNAVNNLPAGYKEPLAMSIAGFKHKEISKKLGLPLNIVKSRIAFVYQYAQGKLDIPA